MRLAAAVAALLVTLTPGFAQAHQQTEGTSHYLPNVIEQIQLGDDDGLGAIVMADDSIPIDG